MKIITVIFMSIITFPFFASSSQDRECSIHNLCKMHLQAMKAHINKIDECVEDEKTSKVKAGKKHNTPPHLTDIEAELLQLLTEGEVTKVAYQWQTRTVRQSGFTTTRKHIGVGFKDLKQDK